MRAFTPAICAVRSVRTSSIRVLTPAICAASRPASAMTVPMIHFVSLVIQPQRST